MEILGVLIVFTLVFLFLLLSWIPEQYYSLKNKIILLILFIILLIFGLFIYLYLANKGIKNWIYKQKIIDSIEKSLISIGAFEENDSNLVLLPKIKVLQDTKTIEISLRNVSIRSKLDRVEDIISTALPCNLVANKVYMTKNQAFLLIEYIDLNENNRIIFKTPNEFVSKVKSLSYSSLLLDNDVSIDLRDNPHILITGGTGSGKSYYANQIVLQALIKGYQVSILDYKRSYQVYRKHCQVAFTVEDIHSLLSATIEELHKRQEEMDSILESNPNALAIEHGYPVHLVVFEEYLALVNSGADKKVLADIEKKILEITTTGRALGIHILMIMQQSSATTVSTSIRANLSCKLVFGSAPKSILETTFGIGSVPSISTKFEKGEGLGTFDIDIFTFQAPTFDFKITDILKMLDANK